MVSLKAKILTEVSAYTTALVLAVFFEGP